ncbi:hypothetical protein LX15_000817 [Streptoalloteichus tenebrarius]|uniref:CdiI immunity protein domain-containing protein n=1 Tax=Streptoalloteichus tenebrarius (strain ATCC 17920 / DSM 40477 / JCM 4838 / CBS 697.72 / NBRC 16177 / NCIMB 11028 / NRRL B-12390 / A12253. 1 / ISP 5477) TaxID=1933 RepID=A0ABT1HNP3_STRSD|nr:contact-dependent growth inhibition system immunity protein [Streptoalloteichus tenebrarius]MCP2257132.1 hypothetical protein [Streptoalloteichus tenebrarius]BFE98764.1 hypothetical protein GCM10020241_04400 [Streptoalloteichus tenebrarius]
MTETLVYLARCYFHQDYDLLAPTPLGMVESFVANECQDTVNNLLNEINELFATRVSEDEAETLWMRRGNSSTSRPGSQESVTSSGWRRSGMCFSGP